MERKTHIKPGIYMVKNIVTNDFYIGGTRNIYYRLKNHDWTLKNKRHGNSRMQNDALKHGSSSFSYEVLEFCEIDKLGEREQYFIDILMPTYNKWTSIKIPKGYKHSSESIKKMTKNNGGIKDKIAFIEKLKAAWARRRTLPGYKESIKHLDRTGRKHSEETKLKVGAASKKLWADNREMMITAQIKKGDGNVV